MGIVQEGNYSCTESMLYENLIGSSTICLIFSADVSAGDVSARRQFSVLRSQHHSYSWSTATHCNRLSDCCAGVSVYAKTVCIFCSVRSLL